MGPANMIGPGRRSRHVAQYMALVDILFATIGIFVIVYALQDLDPPVDLRPASYDALVLCGPDRITRLHQGDGDPTSYTVREIAGPLTDALENAGRVLVGISTECAIEADGLVPADRLNDLVRVLSDRNTEDGTLTLFEVAPLGDEGFNADALLERFDVAREVDE